MRMRSVSRPVHFLDQYDGRVRALWTSTAMRRSSLSDRAYAEQDRQQYDPDDVDSQWRRRKDDIIISETPPPAEELKARHAEAKTVSLMLLLPSHATRIC